MTRMFPFAAGLAVAVMTALPMAAQASDPTDIIDYRKHIMKTLGETSAAMNMTVQGTAPAENFVLHTEVLASAASSALVAFKENVEGGGSKPDVWSKWPDFEKRMTEFAAATADLAKTAREGGMEAAKPKLQGALTCRGCHDLYREKK